MSWQGPRSLPTGGGAAKACIASPSSPVPLNGPSDSEQPLGAARLRAARFPRATGSSGSEPVRDSLARTVGFARRRECKPERVPVVVPPRAQFGAWVLKAFPLWPRLMGCFFDLQPGSATVAFRVPQRRQLLRGEGSQPQTERASAGRAVAAAACKLRLCKVDRPEGEANCMLGALVLGTSSAGGDCICRTRPTCSPARTAACRATHGCCSGQHWP